MDLVSSSATARMVERSSTYCPPFSIFKALNHNIQMSIYEFPLRDFQLKLKGLKKRMALIICVAHLNFLHT